MDHHSLKRNVILVLASILLGGTIFGAYQFHCERNPDDKLSWVADTIPTEAEVDSAGTVQSAEAEQSSSTIAAATLRDDPLTAIADPHIFTRPASQTAGQPSSNLHSASRPMRVRREQTFSLALVPPPPPETSSLSDDVTPPIPPNTPSAYNQQGTLLDNLTLTAIIDNRAIFKINTRYRRRHGLPNAVSLGPGDEFEKVSLVTIDGDNVTVSEGHKRSVKTIAVLR